MTCFIWFSSVSSWIITCLIKSRSAHDNQSINLSTYSIITLLVNDWCHVTINTAFESQSVDESRFYAIQSHLIDCDFSDHLPVVYLDTRNIAAECTVEWGWTMRHPSHRVILIWYFSWTHTHHILLHLSNKKSVTWPYHQNVRNFTLNGVTTWNFWAPKVFLWFLKF